MMNNVAKWIIYHTINQMNLFILLVLILLSLAALIFLPFIAVDLWYKFDGKRKARDYGKLTNLDEWKSLVEETSQEWIRRAPVVPFNPQSRLRLWDALFHSKRTAAHIKLWQHAGLVLGLIETKNPRNNELIVEHISEHINLSTGKWRKEPEYVELALLAYAFLRQNVVDVVTMRPAMEQIYDLIIKEKGEYETVPYRAWYADFRFVDTLGFICPFLYCYGALFQNKDAISLAERQLKEYDQALIHRAFPAHAYDVKRQLPMGIYDWGRGLGWYCLALTECHHVIREYNLEDSLQLDERMLHVAERCLEFQTPRGGFRAMYFNSITPEDCSATVLCGLLFERCYHISHDEQYRQAARRAIDHLMYFTIRGGKIDRCQGDTINIGQYAWLYGYMPFAQGLALKLACKLL